MVEEAAKARTHAAFIGARIIIVDHEYEVCSEPEVYFELDMLPEMTSIILTLEFYII